MRPPWHDTHIYWVPENHSGQIRLAWCSPESGLQVPVDLGHLEPPEINLTGINTKQNVFNDDHGWYKCDVLFPRTPFGLKIWVFRSKSAPDPRFWRSLSQYEETILQKLEANHRVILDLCDTPAMSYNPHWAGVEYHKRSWLSTALCGKSDEVIRQHWDNVQSIQLGK